MNKVKHIVIVGGGSSAWMTATYLSRNIREIKITVIDKEIGNPVGVGEGTTLAFMRWMQECGFSMDEWLLEVDATYKAGIVFPNWIDKGTEIWHPFYLNQFLNNGESSTLEAWSKNQHLDFKKYAVMLYDSAINQNKVDLNFIADAYAFHIDCGKLVTFLQRKANDKISFIKSEVVDIIKNNNNIESLKLANGSVISGDLYIDCTGFKGMLNENKKRVDVSNRLFCDTAIAGHIPYINQQEEMRPYVVSEAVSCGWIWDIPVQSRIGSGLVFNRSVTDIEEAKDYFCNYWNNRITKDKLKVLYWDPFYNENFWEGNVVSIGLSAGFIEPLESTGLALISLGINRLAAKIKDNSWDNIDVNLYNSEMKRLFEECIDFVSMHYSKTNRPEPFWQYVREKFVATKSLTFKINQVKEQGPLLFDSSKELHVFSGQNWTCWLAQMGYPIAESNNPVDNKRSEELLLNFYNGIEKYRSNHSRDHYTEICRLKEFYKGN